MNPPDRETADPGYRIDLTTVYETPAGWEAARERLEAELDDLERRAEEPLEVAKDLRALLERTEACFRRKQRVRLYVDLANGLGLDSAPARNRYDALEATFEETVAAVRRRLRDTDGRVLDEHLAELDGYDRYAANLRTRARHVQSPDVGETVAAFAGTRRAPTEVIRAVWRDYDPPTVERPGGRLVEISGGVKRRAELAHPDRDYRRRVHEAFWGELERFEATLTTALVSKIRAASAHARVRGYDSVRDRDLHGPCEPETGLTSALPEEVHDVMLEAVRDNLDPYHRALERRKERLGLDTLRLWDLDAPTADGDAPEIDYETAKSHVLAALEPLGDEYADRLRGLFADRRIDVYPGEGKGGVAYCLSSTADGPFVRVNFRRDVASTFVLCHELGHAMHAEHYREAPPRYATCPRHFSEVPSALHEILLAEHLVERGGALASVARDRLLTTLRASVYRSTMVAAFVHELVRRVERGDSPGPEDVRGIQRDVSEAFRAPVELGEDAGRTWLGRGTRDLYDSYAYVLGAVGALAVRERLRTGDLTADTYRAVLRSTGREPSVALFDRLGCDVATADPYERAVEAFEGHVDGTTTVP